LWAQTTTTKDASIETGIGGIVIKTRTWLIYFFGLPADVLCALLALALAPFQKGLGLTLERRPNGPGLYALTLDVRRLPGEIAAVTIAPHVIFYRSGRHFGQGWSVLQDHEHEHVEQYEGACLMGAALAAIALGFGARWFVALAIWAPAPWLFMLAGYAIAWLRGEDLYSGSINEESAYVLSADRSNR
jgi:hypothetical protein